MYVCLIKFFLFSAFHRQQAAFFDNIRRQNEYSYKGKKDNRYAPNYSAAAASIGPNGAHQTAFINPENPVRLTLKIIQFFW